MHMGRSEEPVAHQCPQSGFCGEHVACGRGLGSLGQVIHGRHPYWQVTLESSQDGQLQRLALLV